VVLTPRQVAFAGLDVYENEPQVEKGLSNNPSDAASPYRNHVIRDAEGDGTAGVGQFAFSRRERPIDHAGAGAEEGPELIDHNSTEYARK
jgi:hypothetical protein